MSRQSAAIAAPDLPRPLSSAAGSGSAPRPRTIALDLDPIIAEITAAVLAQIGPRIAAPALLTVPAAARHLGVSESTVRRWIDTEGLPHMTIDSVTRIGRAALEQWIADRQETTT